MSRSQLIVFGAAIGILVVLLVTGWVVRMARRRDIDANRAKADELHAEDDRTRLQAEEQAANAA